MVGGLRMQVINGVMTSPLIGSLCLDPRILPTYEVP